eukprot:6192643-Pleurochrysis_carterae.AAC.1
MGGGRASPACVSWYDHQRERARYPTQFFPNSVAACRRAQCARSLYKFPYKEGLGVCLLHGQQAAYLKAYALFDKITGGYLKPTYGGAAHVLIFLCTITGTLQQVCSAQPLLHFSCFLASSPRSPPPTSMRLP